MMTMAYLFYEAALIPTPEGSGVESLIQSLVLWVELMADVVAAFLIATGILITLAQVLKISRSRVEGYEHSRLVLARFLALALEFQLAADVLGTAVSPTWTQIGKLAAIAVIRTALNYFLAKEIKEEELATGVIALENEPAT